jgi:plasmid maintenance system killer protein
MEISVRDHRLRAALLDESICKRRYGSDMAKKIENRLASLDAAPSLADFWPPKSGPERCHELVGDLAGTFSIDVTQPYRLLFVPIEEEGRPADRSDEQKRWASITAIEILRIEDTHG